LGAVRSRAAAPATVPTLDAESREKLASLGYLSGGAATPIKRGSGRDPHEQTAFFRAFEEAHWATLEGRAAEAVGLLRPLVEADPDNAIFRAHLARAYRESGQSEESVDEYRRAFADAPGDPQVGYELALALQKAGEISEATTVLSVVLRTDASRPEAHNALGILYSLEGQADRAREQFERALAIDPKDAVVLNNLGNSLRDLRSLDGAAKAYRRAIELAPGYADPLNGLGSVLVAQGHAEEALPLFDRALSLAPDRHEVRLNRAVALELGGDRAAAIDAYRGFVTASEADPDFAEQREIATRLALQLEEEGAANSTGIDSRDSDDGTH
jgi:Flp pilus assembly protein TadD